MATIVGSTQVPQDAFLGGFKLSIPYGSAQIETRSQKKFNPGYLTIAPKPFRDISSTTLILRLNGFSDFSCGGAHLEEFYASIIYFCIGANS